MSNDNDDMDGKAYAVGYGKPPKATQFKKGNTAQSSNCRKASKPKQAAVESFEEMLAHALLQPVSVKKGNKISKVPFIEAFLQKFVSGLSSATQKQQFEVIKHLSSMTAVNDQIAKSNAPPAYDSIFSPEQEAKFLKIDAEFLIDYCPEDGVYDSDGDDGGEDVNDLDADSL